MSKKRKRDGYEVNIDLVQVYENLASEDEPTRTKAASKLLRGVFEADTVSDDQLKQILRRLFRGLCSGRKAARQGFAVALTELLDQISDEGNTRASFGPKEVIDILETETQPDANTTGQDGRDHYFGQVFGAESIIQSGLVSRSSSRDQWKRLLDLICHIAKKKPWLRQECGWVLRHFFESRHFQPDQVHLQFAEDIISTLSTNKLIRTPEGVVIWLAAKGRFPKEKLVKHVWKHGHPLAHKDVEALAQIMRDAKPNATNEEDGPQGAAIWSSRQHFAWRYIISYLLQSNTETELISFGEFWQIVIDKNMLDRQASKERCQNGLGVWKEIIETADSPALLSTFTKDAVHLLVSCSIDRQQNYLQKTCRAVLQALEGRVRSDDDLGITPELRCQFIQKILEASGLIDFDKVTKTKTIENLVAGCSDEDLQGLSLTLWTAFEEASRENPEECYRKQKCVLDLTSMLLTVNSRHKGTTTVSELQHGPESSVLNKLITFVCATPQLDSNVHKYAKERLATAFEQCLRLGLSGRCLFVHAIHEAAKMEMSKSVESSESDLSLLISPAIVDIGRSLTELLETASSMTFQMDKPKQAASVQEGILLLKSFLVFDVLSGEADSGNILQDLQNLEEQSHFISVVIEALLSLMSRQSKLTRAITTLVFESMTTHLEKANLESFSRILLSSENIRGQQDMFEAPYEDGNVVSQAVDLDMDSDVEVLDASDEDAGKETDTSSEASSSESEGETSVNQTNGTPKTSRLSTASPESDVSTENGDHEDEELAKFDAALASALGTNPDVHSSESESDVDMDDDEMLALDEKLTEVFRARSEASQSSKKRERKDARENMTNFKNRVLDLVDIYIRQQHLNPLVLELILPILEMVRTTNQKQIAARGCSTLRELNQKCKGRSVCSVGKEHRSEALKKLKAVHVEAGRESSNAHKSVASSMSILLVKTLLHSGMEAEVVVHAYGETSTRWLTEKSCKINPSFFTDWNNWCVSARVKLAK